MAIGIGAASASEAELMRKLGETRRIYSARQRLVRLQKEAKPSVGSMIRPNGQIAAESSNEKA